MTCSWNDVSGSLRGSSVGQQVLRTARVRVLQAERFLEMLSRGAKGPLSFRILSLGLDNSAELQVGRADIARKSSCWASSLKLGRRASCISFGLAWLFSRQLAG